MDINVLEWLKMIDKGLLIYVCAILFIIAIYMTSLYLMRKDYQRRLKEMGDFYTSLMDDTFEKSIKINYDISKLINEWADKNNESYKKYTEQYKRFIEICQYYKDVENFKKLKNSTLEDTKKQ